MWNMKEQQFLIPALRILPIWLIFFPFSYCFFFLMAEWRCLLIPYGLNWCRQMLFICCSCGQLLASMIQMSFPLLCIFRCLAHSYSVAFISWFSEVNWSHQCQLQWSVLGDDPLLSDLWASIPAHTGVDMLVGGRGFVGRTGNRSTRQVPAPMVPAPMVPGLWSSVRLPCNLFCIP